MATRQYIGARYVPKFYQNSVDGSTQWEPNVVYEPLVYVTLQNGHMYISKKQVPATIGTPASNIDYWLDMGSYNGFIDELQGEIDDLETALTETQGDVTDLDDKLSDYIDAGVYNFFRNKKVLIVGDSLSDETVQAPNWVAKLRAKCANIGTEITNLSVAGLGWCSSSASSGGLIDAFNDVTDVYDIVILFAGINDYNSQFPLGTSGSSGDRTSFAGALYDLHSKIHSKCPSAIVYYCTSPHTTIWTQAQKPIPHNRYRFRAYSACNRFGWLMVDTTVLPNYNLLDYQSEYSDGIHPKTSYAQTLCDHIMKAVAAGGETPKVFGNRYDVTFDSPYTSSLRFYFYNDGRIEITFIQNESFTSGNKTVVDNPDGGYVNNGVIAIPTQYGTIGLYMWSSDIIINVPATLPTGYSRTIIYDYDGNYGMPIDY